MSSFFFLRVGEKNLFADDVGTSQVPQDASNG